MILKIAWSSVYQIIGRKLLAYGNSRCLALSRINQIYWFVWGVMLFFVLVLRGLLIRVLSWQIAVECLTELPRQPHMTLVVMGVIVVEGFRIIEFNSLDVTESPLVTKSKA